MVVELTAMCTWIEPNDDSHPKLCQHRNNAHKRRAFASQRCAIEVMLLHFSPNSALVFQPSRCIAASSLTSRRATKKIKPGCF